MDVASLEAQLRDAFCDEACIGHERGCIGCPLTDAIEYMIAVEQERNQCAEMLEGVLDVAVSMILSIDPEHVHCPHDLRGSKTWFNMERCRETLGCCGQEQRTKCWRNWLLAEARRSYGTEDREVPSDVNYWKARAGAAERTCNELNAALERAIDLLPSCPDRHLARIHTYDDEYVPQDKCLDCWFHYNIKDPRIVGKPFKNRRDCWREYVTRGTEKHE